jgi:hypothetical protein
VEKYHLRADIYVILQMQENYIAVEAVVNKRKRKNIFANQRSQNLSIFVVDAEEVLLKKMLSVIHSL